MSRVITISLLLFSFLTVHSFADNAAGEVAYNDKNYEVALVEFTKAADNNDMNAQYNLGLMYEHGHGVDQSDLKAGEWYQLAADNGHPEAPMALQLLYEYF
ncbi:MAG: tetratricopeptide repeat protein [Emcibacteraceae bacterium]|nr:tetratricopeptide repeat protein [Emcibacteraceae bacterium]